MLLNARPASSFRRAALLFALAPLLLLFGCAGEGAIPDHGFRLDSRFEASASVKESDLSRWWLRFRAPSLTRLVEASEFGNLDIAAAMARIEAAQAQARITGAVLLPALTLSSDAARTENSGTMSRRVGAQHTAPGNAFSGALAASYELDLWGRNRDLLTGAKATVAAAIYARAVVRLSTQVSIVNSYIALGAAEERLAIAQGNLANATRLLTVILERLKAGTGSALDVAQQEGVVATQQAALPGLRQTIAQSRTSIALLLGRAPEGFALKNVRLNAMHVPEIAPGQPASLLLRRPDIRNAEAQLLGANANLSAARKALLPSIQLSSEGGLQSAALSTLLKPQSAIWSLAAGLTQPIFDGGRLNASVDLAESQQQELIELYCKSIVSALVDVENALIAVRESAAQERAQRVVVEKAQLAFRLSEERLRSGTIDLQTVINTQNTLFQAQDNLVQSRLSRLQASVSLFSALGGDFATAQP